MKKLLGSAAIVLFHSLVAQALFAQTGTITTYAGPRLPAIGAQAATQVMNPESAIPDGSGGLYVGTYLNRIYHVAADGTLAPFAGTGTAGFSGDGGPATLAQLSNQIRGMAVDAAGNVFIADTANNRVRKVTPAGIISTIAGTGTRGFSGDGGPATSAQLGPQSVALDSAGNLFIADSLNAR